jgi:hypothetical protein
MHFDTQTLIRLAKCNGMTLTRSGGFIYIHYPHGEFTATWEAVFRKHKPELLQVLPDRKNERQIDLFYDDF